MPSTSSWLIPLALFLLLGLAASLYLARIRFPHEARAAGLRALGSLPWSDFIQLVLAVLNARGFERSFGGAGTEGEYLLERGGQKWLLSSRHSRAWTPGSTAIAEFAAHMRHQGLQGGILAIPGRFPPAAASVGKAHRIQLLDGPSMWTELAPALTDEQHQAIEQAARRRLRGQYLLAWTGALVIAVVVGMAWRDRAGVAATPQAPVARKVAAAAAPASESPGSEETPASSIPVNPVHESVLPVEERRTNIAQAVSELPHVRSATWSSPSTLQVAVDSTSFDPQTVCPLIESDADLGASRLQVQYPAGSDRPVRFLQCRAY